ncbi:hypothetical protein KCU90_g133, partial [Aureobasidium melanogenum]
MAKQTNLFCLSLRLLLLSHGDDSSRTRLTAHRQVSALRLALLVLCLALRRTALLCCLSALLCITTFGTLGRYSALVRLLRVNDSFALIESSSVSKVFRVAVVTIIYGHDLPSTVRGRDIGMDYLLILIQLLLYSTYYFSWLSLW